MVKQFTLIYIFILFSCSTKKIDYSNVSVRLNKSDPPTKCKEVNTVQGGALSSSGGQAKAKRNLKYNAHLLGANYVRIDTIETSIDNNPLAKMLGSSQRYTITGTAYLCP